MLVIPPFFNTLLPVFKKHSIFSERYPFDFHTIHTPMRDNPEWHDYVIIYYTISGSYLHTFNGITKMCRPGSAVLIYPFTTYMIDTTETDFSDACIAKLSIVEYPSKLVPLTYKEAAFGRTLLPNYIKFDGGQKELADNIFMNISAEYSKKQNLNKDKIKKYTADFFELCAKHESISIPRRRFETMKAEAVNAQRVSEYIDDHCRESVSIDKMCSLLNVSRRSFTTQFKAVTNQTYNQYAVRVRVDRAFRTFRYSTKSVTEIAEEFGYSSDTRFIHSYRQVFGVSPLAMKKKMLEYSRLYGEILNKSDFDRHAWKGILNETELFEHHSHAIANY